ncbi:MAG: aconitase/3-isopropylmalate dehydratase large subunit family protein [Prolixibacteraceae bacterium]
MTIIEKIIARHSGRESVLPGEIVDVHIDVRLARDFGGANVVKNLVDNNLRIADSTKTWFTFDCNPTGSDQKYAANQQSCRLFAREHKIPVYDLNSGIGTHLAIDQGLALPGDTLVSTDSHANILGAIGCFGQGMGDRDIAAVWSRGAVWFKVPPSVKITLSGKRPEGLLAKDIVLNLLHRFGANSLLGYSVEIDGEEADRLTLDERITISSMATEMGAIALFFTPSEEILSYCFQRSGREFSPVFPDPEAGYEKSYTLDLAEFFPALSFPGKPHDVVPVQAVQGRKIDSAFIGSCTNGRLEDLRLAASLLKGRKVAPGVVLKIVPSTDEIWNACLEEGLLAIFKESGALVSNAGCAGCASGQVGQNGPGEVTISTGNRNFAGKQGKGEVFLASPATAAASAIAGFITTAAEIPEKPLLFGTGPSEAAHPGVAPDTDKATSSGGTEEKVSGTFASPASHSADSEGENNKPTLLEGKVWLVMEDNIDTDMIFHNRHLAITEPVEMGAHAFGNLKGWEDYASRSEPGDIILTGSNFGAGSSRQQAVDCFRALGNQAIIARSFGAIYERNAINAGFPILTCDDLSPLDLKQRDRVAVDLEKSTLTNLENGRTIGLNPFSGVQMQIYQAGDLLQVRD